MDVIKLRKKNFERGETIFKESEIGTEAYLVKKGHVAIWRQEGDQRVHLAVRNEGAIVGEMALVDDTVRSATVTAEDDVETEIITRADLQKMVEMAPVALAAILHQLMESLRTADDLISMYASRPPSDQT
jgi:CRP-like cAMP-binding protein